MQKKSGFWETFILIAIFLVIIQTFIEDFAVIQDWSVRLRQLLILTGLFFDFLFTVEYFFRQTRAIKRKNGWNYFTRERGWIDFFASVPLLLLNSGPMAFLLLTGEGIISLEVAGVLNILKVIKSVRVTRVLRFIRMIKLFGKIYNPDSKMAQRHIARITSMSVVVIVLVLIGTSFIKVSQKHYMESIKRDYGALVKTANENSKTDAIKFNSQLKILLKTRSDFISAELLDNVKISQFTKKEIEKSYSKDDLFVINFDNNKIKITISKKAVNISESQHSLVALIIIIVLVITLLIFYTKHFAQTVSDVIHIMRRGMSEADYSLKVKINEHYPDDEIYKLAELYNDQWLVLKDLHRPLGEKAHGETEAFSLDDFLSANQGDGEESKS